VVEDRFQSDNSSDWRPSPAIPPCRRAPHPLLNPWPIAIATGAGCRPRAHGSVGVPAVAWAAPGLRGLSRMERHLAAVMIADVVGYSRLSSTDEEGTRARFRCDLSEVFQPSLARHHGRLVKTMGDGLLIEFRSQAASPSPAVPTNNCAARRTRLSSIAACSGSRTSTSPFGSIWSKRTRPRDAQGHGRRSAASRGAGCWSEWRSSPLFSSEG